MRDPVLEQAIAAVGGVSALARRIGVSQPAISGWKRVPPERVLAVESATGIARAQLRPDLYGQAEPDAIDALDAGRADIYALIATLLWRAPDAALLRQVGTISGDGSEIGRALAGVAAVAKVTSPEAAENEHFELFTGVGGGELFPYASYYQTGFMHERPLAEVRQDLHRLGLVRAEGISEPEDHAAFLCEMMAVLIRGGEGSEDFFARHLAPWIGGFFRDLERAEAGRFYRMVGTLGRVFVEIESAAFALPV